MSNYAATILADSEASGSRITSMELTFPRFLLPEANTHKGLMKNSASSRAIPVATRIKQVTESPFMPEEFGRNQKGMSSSESLSEEEQKAAEDAWLWLSRCAIEAATKLDALKVHKQHANRVLELWSWHTVVLTGTERRWQNFFALRAHKDAQPEMQIIAWMAKKAYEFSRPVPLSVGEWHLPYIKPEDHTELIKTYPGHDKPTLWEMAAQISVVRCASTSYSRQYATRTFDEVFARHTDLRKHAHYSPFEHQAKVASAEETLKYGWFKWNPQTLAFVADYIGPFAVPWLQYRKTLPNEDLWVPPVELK